MILVNILARDKTYCCNSTQLILSYSRVCFCLLMLSWDIYEALQSRRFRKTAKLCVFLWLASAQFWYFDGTAPDGGLTNTFYLVETRLEVSLDIKLASKLTIRRRVYISYIYSKSLRLLAIFLEALYDMFMLPGWWHSGVPAICI